MSLAAKHRESLKRKFRKVDFFSATSDIWSRSNKSFIAVSVHYFDGLVLKTSFIACESFPGRHTNDKVAQKLHDIFTRYDILNKIFFMTTDGAAEYCAAFKYYSDNYNSIALVNNENFDWEFFDGAANESNAHVVDGSSEVIGQRNTNDDDDSDSETEDFVGYSRTNIQENNDNNGNVFATRDLFEGDYYGNTQLLPNMNRIACSSHILDKLG